MNKSLSIPEWHRLAADGNAPPVRIKLNGGSMNPLIRWNRDYVTVLPAGKDLNIGDIVLFYEPGTERYIIHRIWDIAEGKVQTWGDHLSKPDSWMPLEAVWGKVVLIERGRRRIIPDPKKGILWGKIWHKLGIVDRFF